MKITALLVCFTVVLSGCVSLPSSQKVYWQNHQQQLENLTDWAITGKLAIITPEERHSLNIHWLQTDKNFHIRLSTFLGGTVLEVQKTPFGTQITDDDGNVFWGEDAQLLIAELSGLIIPIDVLQQWIKGNPNTANYQLDENNHVKTLSGSSSENENWSVNYSHYKYTHGINLPYKLQLKRQDLRLKFAISNWEVHPLK